MIKETKKINNILFATILAASLVSILFSTYRYFLKQDFTMADRIPCSETEKDCFIADDYQETPYKVLVLAGSSAPTCIDKEECDLSSICGDLPSSKCKVVSCLDTEEIPEGFSVSGCQ